MKVRATAPAKLILVGEYAVVEGAPAVVAAVDRRVQVDVGTREGEGWVYRTDADGGAQQELHLDVDGSLRDAAGRPAEDDPASRLLALVVAHALGEGRHRLPRGLDVAIQSRALRADADGQKLGLGSSAAVTVALGAALRRIVGSEDAAGEGPAGLRLDLAAHRLAQGGRGSGADVAASFHGGVIRFQRADDGTVRCRSMVLPPDLHLRCFWTGRSAKTGEFLARAEACRRASPAVYAARMRRLEELAKDAADAFENANTEAFLDACAAYAEGLEALGEALGRPIVSEPHRALSALAHRSGAVYKPSGAGGGDIGVAFGGDPDGLERLVRNAAEAGYPALDIDVDPLGVETLVR